MGEHQNHTQFLRQCLRYDDSSQRHELEKTFSQLQRDLRCVRRATWLMAVLATLAVAGLGYAAVFTDNFPYNLPPFILNLICTLAVGSLISLLAFMGLGMVYCRQLGQRREECRQLVAKLLASRLGQPAAASSPENQIQTGGEVDGTVQAAGEVAGSPVTVSSVARG